MNKADLQKEIAAIQETLILQLESIITDTKEINYEITNKNLTKEELKEIINKLESLNNKLDYIESLKKAIK